MMVRYKYSGWYYKLLAWLLAAVCLVMGFVSGFITIFCLNNGSYRQEHVYQTTYTCAELVRSRGYEIIDRFWRTDRTDWAGILYDTELRFIILDEATGQVKASYVDGLGIAVPENMGGNPYLYESNYVMRLGDGGTVLENVYVMDYYFGSDSAGYFWSGSNSSLNYEGLGYGKPFDMAVSEMPQVELGMAAGDQQADKSSSYQILYLLPKYISPHGTGIIGQGYALYQEMTWWGTRAPILFVLCAIGLLVSAVFLCIQSGRKPERAEIRGTWLEKMPLEVHLFVDFWAVIGIWGLLTLAYDMQTNSFITVKEWYLVMFLLAAGAMACAAVLVELLVTVVLRAKLGKLLQSSLIFRFLRWLWRGFSSVFRWMGALIVKGFHSMGMAPRAALIVLGALVVEVVLVLWLMMAWHWLPLILALLVIYNIFLLLAIFWAVGQMKLLQRAAKELADGNLEHQTNTMQMYWDFRQHGEHLNAIAGGMQKAVEKQMKSERLKTELITNVSHDIKTPLTSIVNYVDLLQKPHTEAEGIQYLEVLDRQAKRLKKLTENLVEASKASTGNMAVHLEPTSVMELVNQAVEEYRDRLEAGKLEVVVSQRGDLQIMADGKLMWRILDNLLNNVIKYAMPGTRVYVTAQKWEERVVIAVKNISRDPLNMDAEELMERFVRGDSSRHTEGTGLGLNIARSLTQLQNGQFSLTVDGDFFKAEVSMPQA